MPLVFASKGPKTELRSNRIAGVYSTRPTSRESAETIVGGMTICNFSVTSLDEFMASSWKMETDFRWSFRSDVLVSVRAWTSLCFAGL